MQQYRVQRPAGGGAWLSADQAMESEIATELPRLELDLAEVADSCIKGKHDIAKEVAEHATNENGCLTDM